MNRLDQVLIDHPRHAEPIAAGLTVSTAKATLFSVDTYFVESWRQLSELTQQPLSFAHRYGIMVLKPDTFAGGRTAAILDWLVEQGFQPVYGRRLRFDRHAIRALWRYQWNMATPQRQALQERIMTCHDSLLVVVGRSSPIRVPTTVHLTDLKGPSLPADRKPEHLRTVLNSTNPILNFVHTADEPADVIRELGIYLDAEQRAGVLRRLLSDQPAVDVAALAQQLVDEHALAAREADEGPLSWDWLIRTADGLPANLDGLEPLIRTSARDWGEP